MRRTSIVPASFRRLSALGLAALLLVPALVQAQAPPDDPRSAEAIALGATGTGTAGDPYVLAGKTIARPGGTAVEISSGHWVIQSSVLSGARAIEAHDLGSLKLEDVRATATAEGVHLANIPEVTWHRGRLQAASTALVARNAPLTMRDTTVTSLQTGIHALGSKVALSATELRVGASGLISDGDVDLFNVDVTGDCQGWGVHARGASLGYELGNIACKGTGVDAGKASGTLSDLTIKGPKRGIVLGGGEMLLRNIQVEAQDTGVDIRGGTVTAKEVHVKGGEVGLRAQGAAVTWTSHSLHARTGVGLSADLGTLDESGGTITGHDTGVVLNGVKATFARDAPTTIQGALRGLSATGGTLGASQELSLRSDLDLPRAETRDVGLRLVGVDAGHSFGTLIVSGFSTGVVLEAGAELRADRLDVRSADGMGAKVTQASTLRFEAGTWTGAPSQDGKDQRTFEVTQQSRLFAKDWTADGIHKEFGRADESQVEVRDAHIGTVADRAGPLEAFRSHVHIEGGKWFNEGGALVIRDPERVNGLEPDDPALKGQPRAHVLKDVAFDDEGAYETINVRDSPVLLEDVKVNRVFKPDSVIKGSFAVLLDSSSFKMLGAKTLIESKDGKGAVHWVPPTGLHPSDLFHKKDGATDGVRIEEATIKATNGKAFVAKNALDGLGFIIRDTNVESNVMGLDLTDVNVVISGLNFTAAPRLLPPVHDSSQVSNATGLRSEWTLPTVKENFQMRDSKFEHGSNGTVLVNHGEGTYLQNNTFANQISFRLGLFPGREAWEDHGLVLDNSQGKGPLVVENRFNATHWSAIRVLGGAARILRNDFNCLCDGSRDLGATRNNGEHMVGVYARDITDPANLKIHDNTFNTVISAIALDKASADVMGNTINATSGGAFDILGDGTQTVLVEDNVINNGGTTVYEVPGIDGRFEDSTALVAVGRVRGHFTRNTIDTGPTGEGCPIPDTCFKTAVRLESADTTHPSWGGPPYPVFVQNTIGYNLFGVDLDGNEGLDGHFRANTFSVHGDKKQEAIRILDHGNYEEGKGRDHTPPLGMDVRGNTFAQGIWVRCHYYDHDGDDALDPPHTPWIADDKFDCADDPDGCDSRATCHGGGGLNVVNSHNWKGSTTFSPLPKRETDPGDYAPPERKLVFIIPGGTASSCTRGVVLEGVELKVTRVKGTTYRLDATPHSRLAGWGEPCEGPEGVKTEFLVDGKVVGSGPSRTVGPLTTEKLLTIVAKARFTSKAFGAQEKQAEEQVWTGEGPRIMFLKSDWGTVFLKGVETLGGVGVRSHVAWGDSYDDKAYVQYEWLGRSERGVGPQHVFNLNPGLDAARRPGTEFILTAQAISPTFGVRSPPETLRFKVADYPGWLDAIVLPGKLEARTERLPGGGGKLVWSASPTLWRVSSEIQPTTPPIEGRYKFESTLEARLELESTGSGKIGGKGEKSVVIENKVTGIDYVVKGSGEVVGRIRVDDVDLRGMQVTLGAEGELRKYFKLSDIFSFLKAAAKVTRFAAELDEFVKPFAGFHVSVKLALNADSQRGASCSPLLPDWRCSGAVEPRVGIVLGAKAEFSKDIKATLKGEGTFSVEVRFPGKDGPVEFGPKKLSLKAQLDVQYYEYRERFTWQEVLVFNSPGQGFVLESHDELAIAPRDWTNGGAFDGAVGRVLSNLTHAAAPAAAEGPGGLLVAWVEDDLDVPYPRSGNIRLAHRLPGGEWRDLGRVAADTLGDRAPSVAALPDGRFLVAWTHDRNETADTATAFGPEVFRLMETRAVLVDPAAEPPMAGVVHLTEDEVLDHHVVATPEGVWWLRNPASAIVNDVDAPDELWMAPLVDGALGAPERRLAGLVHDGMVAHARGPGDTLIAARLLGPNLTAHVNATTLPLAGDAAPFLGVASQPAPEGLYVAYLAPRGEAAYDIREALVPWTADEAGDVTTRTIVENTSAEQLRYAHAAERTLVWMHSDGNRTGARSVPATSEGASVREHLEAFDGRVDLVHAAIASPLRLLVSQTDLATSFEDHHYEGPNAENESEEINVTLPVRETTPLTTDLLETSHGVAPPPPEAEEPPPPTLRVVDQQARALPDGTTRITALVENIAPETQEPLTADVLRLASDGSGTPIGEAAIPALRPDEAATVVTHVPTPEAGVFHELSLDAPLLDPGLPALLRRKPEWHLQDVARDGGTVSFTLRNDGPVPGSTMVAAQLPSAAPLAVGGASFLVPAFGKVAGKVTVPAAFAKLPLDILAAPSTPQTPFDQVDSAGTAVAVDASLARSDWIGVLPVVEGAVDLEHLMWASTVRNATLDGADIAVDQRDNLLVLPALALGDHVLVIGMDDLYGSVRRVTGVVRVVDGGATALAHVRTQALPDGAVVRFALTAGPPLPGEPVHMDVRDAGGERSLDLVTDGRGEVQVFVPPGDAQLDLAYAGHEGRGWAPAMLAYALQVAAAEALPPPAGAAARFGIGLEEGTAGDRIIASMPDGSRLAQVGLEPPEGGLPEDVALEVTAYDGAPPGTPPAPAGTTLLPGAFALARTDGGTAPLGNITLVLAVPAADLAGQDPARARLLHGLDTDGDGTTDKWEVLMPTSVDASGEPVLFTFVVSGLSPFALAFLRPVAVSGGGGGGGGGGPAPVSAPPVVTLGTDGVLRGTVHATAPAGGVVEVPFGSADANLATLRLTASQPLDGVDVQVIVAPRTDAPPPGVAAVRVLDLSVEPADRFAGAELTFFLTAAELGGRAPSRAVLLHRGASDWEAVRTRISEEPDAQGRVAFVATLRGFSPIAIALDDAPPLIGRFAPLDGAVVTPTVSIWAAAYDLRGIASVVFELDGDPVLASLTGETAWFLPAAPLASGAHAMNATFTDPGGLHASASWTFRVDPSVLPSPGAAPPAPGPAPSGSGGPSGEAGAVGDGSGAGAPSPVRPSAATPGPGAGFDAGAMVLLAAVLAIARRRRQA